MTHTATPPADSGYLPNLPMQVKNRILLGILITTPAALLLVIIDQLFMNGSIRQAMDMAPGEIAYWTAVLTVPHIVSSLVTFFDREYIGYYKKYLMRAALVGFGLGAVLPFVAEIGFGSYIYGSGAVLIAMAFYTMYHNLMQQYGISLMMMRQPPTRDFQLWRWLTILPAGLAYTLLMSSFLPVVQENWTALLAGIGIVLAIATVFGIRFVRTIMRNPAHTRIGFVYFLSNMAMIYLCYGLIVSGYGFLATLVPRIIHDLTAFLIYTVHDQNRNAVTVRNPLYVIPRKIGIPPAALCLPIGVGISYVLMDVLGSIYMVTVFVTALNFIHYYMEGHMWKRGTPHRQHVPFV